MSAKVYNEGFQDGLEKARELCEQLYDNSPSPEFQIGALHCLNKIVESISDPQPSKLFPKPAVKEKKNVPMNTVTISLVIDDTEYTTTTTEPQWAGFLEKAAEDDALEQAFEQFDTGGSDPDEQGNGEQVDLCYIGDPSELKLNLKALKALGYDMTGYKKWNKIKF